MRSASLLMLAVTLGGCANGAQGLRPLTYKEPAASRVIASYERCPNGPAEGQQFGPVVAALIIGAASKVLENFGTSLANGAAGGALPSSVAMTNLEIEPKAPPRCLIIIRGDFPAAQSEKDDPLKAERPKIKIRRPDGTLQAGVLPPVQNLQHYIELQLSGSKNAKALTFAPVYVRIDRSIDGDRSGKRELSIALSFTRPGQNAAGGAVLVGGRTIGTPEKFDPLDTGRMPYEAPWFQGFESAADSSAPNLASPLPVTATTTVVETRPTKEGLAFVASVFSAARPAMETAIKGAIDPAQQEAAANSTYDAEAKYVDAEAKARVAAYTYCAMVDAAAGTKSDRYGKSAAARNLQILANKAAFGADLNEPFDADLIAASADTLDKVNVTACNSFK